MPRYSFHSGKVKADTFQTDDSGVTRYEGTGGYVDITFKKPFKNTPVVVATFADTGGADMALYLDDTYLLTTGARIMCKKHSAIGNDCAVKNDIYWTAFERTYST